MFELSASPIIIKLPVFHQDAGGVVTFEGRIRAVNESKAVNSLEYEAYEILAISEGTKNLR